MFQTPLPPDVSVVDSFNSAKDLERSIEDDKIYLRRWPHISPIHIKEVCSSSCASEHRNFRLMQLMLF
jgi:hypothetical protein